MTTETIDRLFLELAQFTSATTAREAELERLHKEAQDRIADLVSIIGDIEQIRTQEGHSLTILCDNPDAASVEEQSAVEVAADFTDWTPLRFFGKTWPEALHAAANASRLFNDV